MITTRIELVLGKFHGGIISQGVPAGRALYIWFDFIRDKHVADVYRPNFDCERYECIFTSESGIGIYLGEKANTII
jgi:hypothetical protein